MKRLIEKLRASPIHLTPEELSECVERLGFGFIFARQHHSAFRAMAEMRKRLRRQNTRAI